MNKKSFYKEIMFKDQSKVKAVDAILSSSEKGPFKEKMISQNLKDNVIEMEAEMYKISQNVKQMMEECGDRLGKLID